MLPAYAADARDLVTHIMDVAHQTGDEIPIQDGFDLYSELVEIRRIHADALPEYVFVYQNTFSANMATVNRLVSISRSSCRSSYGAGLR